MRNTLSLTGLLVGVVLFAALNLFAGTALRAARADLTENKLYTLSEGTRNILKKLEEPITLRFYYSEKLARDVTGIPAYAQRVEEMLGEFAAASRGKLVLIKGEPEPFSEEEDRAVGYGLQGAAVNTAGDLLYLGLVGTNSVDAEEVIPFFHPRREDFLEYDIAELVSNLATLDKKVVGILSTLPVQGAPPNPQSFQPPKPWFVIEQLESLYEVRHLPPASTTEIDPEIDILVVIHPKGFSEELLFAIDQHVLRGGRAMVFVDPHCEHDQSQPPGGNPMMAQRSSELDRLLEAWGVELVEGKLAGDAKNALAIGGRDGRPVPYVVYIGASGDALNGEDFVTADLDSMNFLAAGILRGKDGATTTFEPLVQTTEESQEIDAMSVQFAPDPAGLLNNFLPRGEALTLAARISGPASTAFPDGPPGQPGQPDSLEEPLDDPFGDPFDALGDDPAGGEGKGGPRIDAQDPGADAAQDAPPAPPEEPPQEEQEAPPQEEKQDWVSWSNDINVIVVADADLLADNAWVQLTPFLGTQLAQKLADNGTFFLNAIENLSGSSDLISLRSRGRSQRPFTKKQELERRADEAFRAREEALEAELREITQRINDLQKEKEAGASQLILSPEQKEELERAYEKRLETRKELRNVKHQLNKDIERLGTWLKFVNVLLIPILILLGGVGVLTFRSTRRRQ